MATAIATNYFVSFDGTLFDRKVVNGEPTCITLTGTYCTTADSPEAAIENARTHIASAFCHPVRIHRLQTAMPFGGQKLIDRTVNRGGTKKIRLV